MHYLDRYIILRYVCNNVFRILLGVVALKKKRSLETNLLYFKSQSILCIIADMEKFLCGDCGSISGGASSDGSSGNNRSISSGGSSSSSGSGSDSNDVSGSSNGNSIYCGAFVALDNEDDTFRRALDMLIYIICSTSGNGEDRSLQVRILKRCSALVVQILKCLLSQPQDGSGGGSSSGSGGGGSSSGGSGGGGSSSGGSSSGSGGGSSSGGSGGGGRSSSKKCSRLFFVDGFTREDCDSWIAYGIRCLVTVADSCLSVFQQQDASPHVAGDAMDGAEEDQMMINTIVAVVEFLVDDCFLLAARPSIYSVAAQLTSNDQDMVSFCCTLLKLQLRLEHTEAAISRTDYTETCTSKPARRAQLEVLRGAVHRALEVMAALGFTDVRVFLVFVECVASFDASVVLDLLSNSETVALEYLLRVSKRLLSENRESLAGNLAHLHPYRRDYLANHPHLRVETNRNRNDTGSVDGRATKGKVVVWMKGEESVPINSTCAGVQEDSDDGAGGGVSYRVSKYEWDRDAADQVRSADDALPVAGPTTLDEWIQFLRDLTDTLSSPSTRRSLPFDPTLFVKRLKIILQNIGD